MRQPNDPMRRARLARRSPSGSDRVLSRQELAEAVNAHLYATTGRLFRLDDKYVGNLERGAIHPAWRRALALFIRIGTPEATSVRGMLADLTGS